MPDYKAFVPGLYPIGEAQAVSFPNFGGITSRLLNTRDLGQPGASDFVLLGPGSQVWYACYSVRLISPVVTPTDPLGVTLTLDTSYDTGAPFSFQTEQQIILPVYAAIVAFPYSGRARVEAPAFEFSLFNLTGQDLTISYQFWGKAL